MGKCKHFYGFQRDDILGVAKEKGVKLTEGEILHIEKEFEIYDWLDTMEVYIDVALEKRKDRE